MQPKFKNYTQILKEKKINFAVTCVTLSIKFLSIVLQTTQKSVAAAFGLRSDCVVICIAAHTQIEKPKYPFGLKGS